MVPASSAVTSKEALAEFFSPQEARSIEAMDQSLQICADTCQRYVSDHGFARDQVWDVVFLHQYYYVSRGPRPLFQRQYSSLAKSLMEKYRGLCPRAEEGAKPGCVIGYLGLRNNLKYAEIFDRGDQRCEVWSHLVHSKTTYGSSCKGRHAS
jgi:hypothetical protein